MTTTAKFLAINIDCAEPKKLAEFYAAVFGYEVQYAEDTYAGIGDGTMTIYFQQNLDRKPAAWPGAGKQFHLDTRVPDVEAAVQEYLKLGATKPDFQPGEGGWVVLADPEGHLFCVCPTRD
ncbi:VOC family protein [Streptosporangium sp. NBC_01756]|uniref:VOC family protein n=1 Tax=Streptosporangium sp. NBC_01756 TaxID=2975950 RepID=UPI002DD7E1D4|nr:VOC family protein [Streptosporangium sp. NBC_01756]WSC88536.1 VOC family protein [Streptosporangium sp. NBC_01756]